MAIICHCEAIRERTIVQAIHRGATTVADLQVECGAAMHCGGCRPALVELLERHAPEPVGVHVTSMLAAPA